MPINFGLRRETLGPLTGLFQDVADFEWHIYSTYFCWQLPPLLLVHIALSRAMLHLDIQGQVRLSYIVARGPIGGSVSGLWLVAPWVGCDW